MGHLGGEKIQRTEEVSEQYAGSRLDQAAAELFDGFSRSRLQNWIKEGALTVNAARPKDKLLGGEALTLAVELEPEIDDQPQAIELPVVYQDEDLLVIDKPAGLVVHPPPATPTAPCSTGCCTWTSASPACPGRASCTAWTGTPPA